MTNYKVLVAEDKEINRFIIDRLLKKHGLHPAFAHHGIDAYDMLRANSYDLVFMDIQMPGMTGIEVVRKLKEEAINLPPILALSSNTSPRTQREALEAGMDHYYSKPILGDTLEEIISTHLPPLGLVPA